MRFSYSMPRVVLLIFGVAYFALWVWHPIDSQTDDTFRVLDPAMNYLFPAVFYTVAAVFFLTDRRAGTDSACKAQPTLGDLTPLFALAAVLYLLPLAITGREGWKEGDRIWSVLYVLLEFCFILLCLSFAYEQTSSLAEGSASGGTRWLEKLRQRVGRWFLSVAAWLHPGMLLGTGAILVLASLFLPITGNTGLVYLRGKESWITSIYEVTWGIKPIQFTKAFMGRAVYVIALGLAVTAIILMFRREFRPPISRPSRLWTGLTGLSSFLALYSAADLNFGWLGLYTENRDVQHWTLFCLWLTLWLLPLGLWVWLSLKGRTASATARMAGLDWLILLFLPVVLYDVVMAPALVGGLFLNLTGLASYVAGLQFLCWGFVRSITMNPTIPLRGNSQPVIPEI
jgi:hypothetical protein